jgi:DnaD/phage-associated family protein
MTTYPDPGRPSAVAQFAGFPPGESVGARLPETFISELLPLIDDLIELRVTLYCFWAIQQPDCPRHGDYRYLRDRDVIDAIERLKLAADGQILRAALDKAIQRGTLIAVEADTAYGLEILYFVNTERGRLAVTALEAGEWHPADSTSAHAIATELNIFALYERHFGVLTPAIADTLRDVEATYPPDAITAAIEMAVAKNVRYWRYVENLLKRWAEEGGRDE